MRNITITMTSGAKHTVDYDRDTAEALGLAVRGKLSDKCLYLGGGDGFDLNSEASDGTFINAAHVESFVVGQPSEAEVYMIE